MRKQQLTIVRTIVLCLGLFFLGQTASATNDPFLVFRPADDVTTRLAVDRAQYFPDRRQAVLATVWNSSGAFFRTETGDRVAATIVMSIHPPSGSPYPDKTEAELDSELLKKKKSASGSQDYKVKLDGSWFSLSVFDGRVTSTKQDTLMYFGRKSGLGLMISVSFDGDRVPIERVRGAVEAATLNAPAISAAVQAYNAFVGAAVSPSGLRSGFGSLAFKKHGEFLLNDVTIIRNINRDDEHYYRVGYASDNAVIELECFPSQELAGESRGEFEKKLFSSDVYRELSSPEPVENSSAHRYRYQHKSTSGSWVPEQAWVMFDNGHVRTMSLFGSLSPQQNGQLLDGFLQAGRSCEQLPGHGPGKQ